MVQGGGGTPPGEGATHGRTAHATRGHRLRRPRDRARRRCGGSTPNPSSAISSTIPAAVGCRAGISAPIPRCRPTFLDGGVRVTTTGSDAAAERLRLGGGVEAQDEPARRSRPVARLVDMDEEGIDVAVLYPTAMLTWVEEADIFGAACRAYNNWLHDYCAVAPSRLYPVALVPLQDPRRRSSRCGGRSTHLGAKAVMIRPAALHRRPEAQPSRLRPVLGGGRRARLPDRRAPVAARRHAERVPAARARRRRRPTRPKASRCARASPTRSTSRWRSPTSRSAASASVTRTCGSRSSRAPAAGSSRCSQRFDHQFEIFGSSDQTTLPSEVFARQCMISFDPDEVALAFTAEHLGADKILWASDYPHPDAKIPGVVAELHRGGGAAARGVATADPRRHRPRLLQALTPGDLGRSGSRGPLGRPRSRG